VNVSEVAPATILAPASAPDRANVSDVEPAISPLALPDPVRSPAVVNVTKAVALITPPPNAVALGVKVSVDAPSKAPAPPDPVRSPAAVNVTAEAASIAAPPNAVAAGVKVSVVVPSISPALPDPVRSARVVKVSVVALVSAPSPMSAPAGVKVSVVCPDIAPPAAAASRGSNPNSTCAPSNRRRDCIV
jgi:hypothetical protein